MVDLDVSGAGIRLLAMSPLADRGACLQYVSRALRNGAPALNLAGLDNAWNSWKYNAASLHPGDQNVPVGFPAFFGPSSRDNYGDVVISLGGGQFACTDYPTWNLTGSATLAQRGAQIGRAYLGWAGSFLGYRLTSTSPASSGSTPIAPTSLKEEDMLIVATTDSTPDAPGQAPLIVARHVYIQGAEGPLRDIGSDELYWRHLAGQDPVTGTGDQIRQLARRVGILHANENGVLVGDVIGRV